MKLNHTSYVHVKIRQICQRLEKATGMKLITDLEQEFEILRFLSPLSYMTIDWQKQAYFTMSHHLTTEEEQEVQDLILYLDWLETGRRIQEQQGNTSIATKKTTTKVTTRKEG